MTTHEMTALPLATHLTVAAACECPAWCGCSAAWCLALTGRPVSWGFMRGGASVGGMYATHAAASVTALEFPAYFAGARIVPMTGATKCGRFWTWTPVTEPHRDLRRGRARG
jgi:hypothetical protein